MITMGEEQYTKDAWGRLDAQRRRVPGPVDRNAAAVNPGAVGGIP